MKILIWAMARALGDGVNNTGYPREIKKSILMHKLIYFAPVCMQLRLKETLT